MACGSDQCCSFPAGRQAVQALVWSIFAYLFCASATGGCYFMEIDGYLLPSHPFMAFEHAGSSSIGPFGYEDLTAEADGGYACLSYNSDQVDQFLDAPWKAARVFAICANICNGVAMLFLIATACVTYKPHALTFIGALSILGSIFEWLVFTMFASKVSDTPYNGRFWVGAGFGIVGALCSIITGLLTMSIKPKQPRNYTVTQPQAGTNGADGEGGGPVRGKRGFPAPKRDAVPEQPQDARAFEPGTETVTETIMPDGSKKITRTTIEHDGSKSVSETIVRQG